MPGQEHTKPLEPKGDSGAATWRTSSTATCGCRPDAVARTHQAGQARLGPMRTRKVLATTLLHVGNAADTYPLDRHHRSGRTWTSP